MPVRNRGEPLPCQRRMVNGRPLWQFAPDRIKRRRGRPLPAAREHQQILSTGAGHVVLATPIVVGAAVGEFMIFLGLAP